MATIASQAASGDLGHALFRHKGKATTVFLLLMIGAATVAAVLPKKYRSQALLLVRLGRQNATLDVVATAGEAQAAANPAEIREFQVNSIAAILASRAMVARVVDTIGPEVVLGAAPAAGAEGGPAPGPAVGKTATDAESASGDSLMTGARDETIHKVMKRFNVEAVPKSDLIQISFDAPTPEIAQRAVATLIDAYLEQHARLNQVQGAHDFLARQTSDNRARLMQAEKALLDLKNKSGVASTETQQQALAQRLANQENELLGSIAEVAVTDKQVQAIRGRLATLSEMQVLSETTGGEDKTFGGMREQLFALEIKAQHLLATTKKDYYEMPQLAKELAEARSILQSQPPQRRRSPRGPNRYYEDLQLTLQKQEPLLAALRAKVNILRQQIAQTRAELRDFNERSVNIVRLQRGVEIEDAIYRKYMALAEQDRIDQALETARITSLTVAEPATYDTEPVQPRPIVVLGIGFCLAVFGGVTVPLLAEYRDRSLRTREEIEQALTAPVLAVIPRLRRRDLSMP